MLTLGLLIFVLWAVIVSLCFYKAYTDMQVGYMIATFPLTVVVLAVLISMFVSNLNF